MDKVKVAKDPTASTRLKREVLSYLDDRARWLGMKRSEVVEDALYDWLERLRVSAFPPGEKPNPAKSPAVVFAELGMRTRIKLAGRRVALLEMMRKK